MTAQKVTLTSLADLAACVEAIYGQTPTNSLVIAPFIADGKSETPGPLLRHDLLPGVPLHTQIEAILSFITDETPIENISNITIGIYTPEKISQSTLGDLEEYATMLGWKVLDVYVSNEVEVYNNIARHSRQEVQATPLALTLALNTPEGHTSITPQTPAQHPIALSPSDRPAPPSDFNVLDTRYDTPAQRTLLDAWKNLVQGEATDSQKAIIAAALDNIETRYTAWYMGALAAIGKHELTEENAAGLLGVGLTLAVGRSAINVAQALCEQVGPLVDNAAPILEFQLWANWLGGYFSRSRKFHILLEEMGYSPEVERNIALRVAVSDSSPAYLIRN